MKKIKLISLTLMAFLLTGVLFTCKKEPLDNTQLIINADLVETSFALTFIDAKTGAPIGYLDDNDVTVTPKGDFGNKVVDITGVERSAFISPSGFMALGLEPDVVPSASNPIKFNLVIEANGYVTTSLPILVKEKSRRSYTVRMVKISDPPQGVATIVDHAAVAVDGIVEQAVEVSTPIVSSTNTKATFILPEGVVLKDKNGELLKGALTTTLAYFNNLDESSLACFPGGLIGLLNENGGSEWVEFYSGGFVEIEIRDATGKVLKSFEAPSGQFPAIRFEIPPGTYNPETGVSVKGGDEIPLLSYDVEKGEWTRESTLPIVYDATTGSLAAEGEIRHLTPYNIDWTIPNICDEEGIRVRINGQSGGSIGGTIKVIRLADNVMIRSWNVLLPYNQTFYLGLGPANVPVQLLFYDEESKLRGEAYTNDLCSGSVEIDIAPTTATGTIKVYVDGYCPNRPNLLIKPTLGFWYKNEKQNVWFNQWLINGTTQLDEIILGDNYAFGIYYDGRWIEHSTTVNQNNLDLTLEDIQFTIETCELFQ